MIGDSGFWLLVVLAFVLGATSIYIVTLIRYIPYKEKYDTLKRELSVLTYRFKIISFFSFAAGGQNTLFSMDNETHLYVLKQNEGGYEIVGPAPPHLVRKYRLERAIKAIPIQDLDDLVNRTGIQLPYEDVEPSWPDTANTQAESSAEQPAEKTS